MATHVDIRSNVAEAGSFQINNVNLNTFVVNGVVDIHACLRALQWPNSLAVRTRLLSFKDRIIHGTLDWILQHAQYLDWWDNHGIGLLWIKGGAGKGKTMITLSMIQRFITLEERKFTLSWFFCQRADPQLNNVVSIMQGLIWRLATQQPTLKRILESRWDTGAKKFTVDLTSWRSLWDVFMEMLDECDQPKVLVCIDALDECQGEDMADFLRTLVRSGLTNTSKVKWMLTSRPFEAGDQELLLGTTQVAITLESNAQHIAPTVKAYVADKVTELDRHHHYDHSLRLKIEEELIAKAENTFLWVSVVCKSLESVQSHEAFNTIQKLPSDLFELYDQILEQLGKGDATVVKRSFRLLKAMLLVFGPLDSYSAGVVTGLYEQQPDMQPLIDRCASFINTSFTGNFEIVHESLRSYLAEGKGSRQLDLYEQYSHFEITLNCVTRLTNELTINFLCLPHPDSQQNAKDPGPFAEDERMVVGATLEYAAMSWARHAAEAPSAESVLQALDDSGVIGIFLRTRFLEWLEFSSLAMKLPQAMDALQLMGAFLKAAPDSFMAHWIQDATRFLSRHFKTIATWPLQTYSSALIFSPQSSLVRRENLNKVPKWLRRVPVVDEDWSLLIQTIRGQGAMINSIAVAPDGKTFATGGYGRTFRVWDSSTGNLVKLVHDTRTFDGDDKGAILTLAYSPDGKWVASAGMDRSVDIRDSEEGQIQKTLVGHSHSVTSLAFSRDSSCIASSSWDGTIKLWNPTTGDLLHSMSYSGSRKGISTIAFSPDGKQIASAAPDQSITIWDKATGAMQQTLIGHESAVRALAYSPTENIIASVSHDGCLITWDSLSGRIRNRAVSHSTSVNALTFSPNGDRIATGSDDRTIKLWQSAMLRHLETLTGHSDKVTCLAFSADGMEILSGSEDRSIRIWDSSTENKHQSTRPGRADGVKAIAFAPDGRRIVSGASGEPIKIWDNTTEEFSISPAQVIQSVESDQIHGLAFSHDGKHIVSACARNDEWDGEVATIASKRRHEDIDILDSSSGNLIKSVRTDHQSFIWQAVFSPDGQWIASASFDRTIKIWNAATGKLQKTFEAEQPGQITTLAFTPDGTRLVTSSTDAEHTNNALTVWDIAKFLKKTKFLGDYRNNRRPHTTYSMKLANPVYVLFFINKGACLATDVGFIDIESIISGKEEIKASLMGMLCVIRGWICAGQLRLLYLGSDLSSEICDVRDDQIAVGFVEGRVLRFDFDIQKLISLTGPTEWVDLEIKFPEPVQ